MKKFAHYLVEKLMDIEQLCRQLKSGDIKGETGKWQFNTKRLVQTISRITFLKENIDSKCRLRKYHKENIDHQTSGCHIVANYE